jgi:hypothetical protein
MDNQNGTLHPHSSNCSGVKIFLVARITIKEMNKPTVAVVQKSNILVVLQGHAQPHRLRLPIFTSARPCNKKN